jgi:CubicO group peptidase (beta-lactamase class C family)
MSITARARIELPSAQDFLLWPPGLQAWGYRIVDQLFASRTIRCSGTPRALPRGPELEVCYQSQGRGRSIAEFIERNHAAGLLVIDQGRIVCERYALGLGEHERWSTMSTIKSMTAMLVGVALREGAIESLDDPVTAYLPELSGSAYQRVTIRHLLTMSSGTRWTETYDDPGSDVNRYSRSLAQRVPGGIVSLMRELPAVHAPGSAFLYNSGDSYLLGALVSAATGRRLADFMSERIWQPFGMECDAYYTLESEGGQEIGGSRAGMCLRDFGRFALYVLGDGVIGGRETLPRGWVRDCATPAFPVTDPARLAEGIAGYGYSWWIGDDDSMNALGFAGQRIWIDRNRGTIIVILSAVPQPPFLSPAYPDFAAETRSLIAAIRAATGR